MQALGLHNKKHHTIPELTEKERERFWKRVDCRGTDECWPWKGTTTKGRYGARYGVVVVRKVHLRPHRIAYTLTIGPIPEGLTLDHVKERGCTTALCCNPAHLEPVTLSVNVLRHYAGLPKVCKRGHRKAYKGNCRKCVNLMTNAWYQRNKDRLNEKRRQKEQGIRKAS